MRVYLETSSLVKFYQKEEESEHVVRLFESFLEGRIELYTSRIFLLELARGLTRAGLDEATVSRIEADFRMYIARGLKQIPVSEDVLENALHLIKRNRLGAIDAIHAASALTRTDVLISNDEHLLKSSLRKDLQGSIEIIKPAQAYF